jgi:Ala-tRNA(Pro) deacylase
MFKVSQIYTEAPSKTATELQRMVYEKLKELNIPYERTDTDVAVTMEDCLAIDQKMKMKMVKTLFLCNEEQTDFYLFITAGDKRFASKPFAHQLSGVRVSFAPVSLFEKMLGAEVGAATVFSVLLDTHQQIRVVFDKSVMEQEYYGCSDGTTTCFMKIRTSDIVNKFLPSTHHEVTVIED